MEKINSAAADIFLKNRNLFNEEFGLMKISHPVLDADLFSAELARYINIFSSSNVNSAGDDFENKISEIYSALLGLCADGYLTGRFPGLGDALCTLATQFIFCFRSSPADFLNSTARAMVTLIHTVDLRAWTELLVRAPEKKISPDEYKSFGLICAWILGRAEYRPAALDACGAADPAAVINFFGLSPAAVSDTGGIISRMKNNPWNGPESAAGVKSAGGPLFRFHSGFIGYGGEFDYQPAVKSSGGGIIVVSGEKKYQLTADFFGTALIPAGHDGAAEQAHNSKELFPQTGTIAFGEKKYPVPEKYLCGVNTCASAGHTSAWTSPSSYKIFIAGFPDGI